MNNIVIILNFSRNVIIFGNNNYIIFNNSIITRQDFEKHIFTTFYRYQILNFYLFKRYTFFFIHLKQNIYIFFLISIHKNQISNKYSHLTISYYL